MGSSTFAGLGSAANGAILYCTNCTQTTACAAGGAGAMAMYVNGAWSCAGGQGGNYTFQNNLTTTASTVNFTPLDSTVMNAVDDFLPTSSDLGSVGQLGWSAGNIAGGCSGAYATTGQANHPGVFFLQTTTTANAGCFLTLADQNNGAFNGISNLGTGGTWSSWETQAIVQTDATSIAHARYLVGFSDHTTAYHPAGGNEIAVRFDSGSGGCASNESTTNWIYEVIVNGAQTCYNTGFAVAPNTWYHVRIYSTTPGIIQFQINGAYSGSIATAPTAAVAPLFLNLLASGGAQEGLSIDWWAMKVQGLTR